VPLTDPLADLSEVVRPLNFGDSINAASIVAGNVSADTYSSVLGGHRVGGFGGPPAHHF
jgi:hypothetical protein